MEKLKILVVDDESRMRKLVRQETARRHSTSFTVKKILHY